MERISLGKNLLNRKKLISFNAGSPTQKHQTNMATQSFTTPETEFSLDRVQFNIYEDKSKGIDAKYTVGRPGDGERWNAEGDLPVCRVMWAELHGKGNAGGNFAPAPGLEEYTLKLDLSNDFTEIFPGEQGKAAVLAGAVKTYKENFIAIEESFVSWVFENPIGPLVKFRQECTSNARKSIARSRGVKQSEFTDSDKENVSADALERFRVNFNVIVRTDKNGVAFIQPKSRVNQYRKGQGEEPVYTKVPIMDVSDTSVPLNAISNDDKIVDWGSVVGGSIRLKPYVIASGKFGIKLQLMDVVKIKDRASGGSKKRRRVDYSQVLS